MSSKLVQNLSVGLPAVEATRLHEASEEGKAIIMAPSVLQLTQTLAFKRRLQARFARIAAARVKLELPKAVIIDGVVFRQFPNGRVERADSNRLEGTQDPS